MATALNRQYAMFRADCPRCRILKTTFDIMASSYIEDDHGLQIHEAFLRCRNCFKASIALLRQSQISSVDPDSFSGNYLNGFFDLIRWVFEVPNRRPTPPHVPSEVGRIFEEAATCAAIGAWDAAGTMFRKVLDAATRGRVPKPDSGISPAPANWKIYKDLRLRLDWLFENGRLDRS
jgi:hypothetical protein